MAFKTNGLVVSKGDADVYPTFLQATDVPGFGDLVKEELHQVTRYIEDNLDNKSLCLQAVDTRSKERVVYNENGELHAAHGWRIDRILGSGKDGTTVLAYRYDDKQKVLRTVKLLSNYGKSYLNHTLLFSEIFKSLDNKSNNFFKLHVDSDFTYYNNSKPLNPLPIAEFQNNLIELCRMNAWVIRNTGFVLWDFGFGSGLNYMIGNDSDLKWIDYGGAGMLRCENFDYFHKKYADHVNIELLETETGKENLIFANSNFVMCEFLLHIEYWLGNENADIWSSMIQIRKSILPEFVEVMPGLLKQKLTQDIFKKFKNHDWTDDITWKKVGKYINANT